jgi:hypothetical protein
VDRLKVKNEVLKKRMIRRCHLEIDPTTLKCQQEKGLLQSATQHVKFQRLRETMAHKGKVDVFDKRSERAAKNKNNFRASSRHC